jgi:hypothetical protein
LHSILASLTSLATRAGEPLCRWPFLLFYG